MKLNELKDTNKESTKGSYAAYNFSKNTIANIKQFCKENSVKNALNADKLHTTILYSRKYLPKYEPLGKLDEPIIAKPKEFVIWKSQDGNKCLVLKLSSAGTESRHKHLMKQHDAAYDYDEYHPHITFSYNVGDDVDLKSLNDRIKDLDDMEAVEEYGEDLDLEWNKKNG